MPPRHPPQTFSPFLGQSCFLSLEPFGLHCSLVSSVNSSGLTQMPSLYRDLCWPPRSSAIPQSSPISLSCFTSFLGFLPSMVSMRTYLPPSIDCTPWGQDSCRLLDDSSVSTKTGTHSGGKWINIFWKNATFLKKNKDLGVCPWPFENNVCHAMNYPMTHLLFFVEVCSCGFL